MLPWREKVYSDFVILWVNSPKWRLISNKFSTFLSYFLCNKGHIHLLNLHQVPTMYWAILSIDHLRSTDQHY